MSGIGPPHHHFSSSGIELFLPAAGSVGFRLDLAVIEDVSGSLKESRCGSLFWVWSDPDLVSGFSQHLLQQKRSRHLVVLAVLTYILNVSFRQEVCRVKEKFLQVCWMQLNLPRFNGRDFDQSFDSTGRDSNPL